MSDLVGNPEDRFSRVAAHMISADEWDVKHAYNQPKQNNAGLESIA